MTTTSTIDDFLPFRRHQTWFQVRGDLDAGRTPLVLLHGGPGMAHNYLEPLGELAEDGRPIVFYDQLGCGLSTHLRDASSDFWSIELFLDELDALLIHLGISKDYHLLGHSWGGMLAAEHAVRAPPGLRSLILSNSLASSASWAQGATRLRGQLPRDTAAALDRHEAAGRLGDAEYLAAIEVYYSRHVCRVPLPDFAQASFTQMADDPTVYQTMWGPNEFTPVGSLKEWTIVERLEAIVTPTLVISGEYDEATSECQKPFIQKIPLLRQIVLPRTSHMGMIEEPESYRQAISAFLSELK
jgi:L-proline amide hydrolase